MRDYKKEICDYLDNNWDTARRDRRAFFEKLLSSKYICLFGAGQVGQAVAYDLTEIGVAVTYFCDNNSKLWGKYINQRIKCVSIEELEKNKKEVLILVTTGYFSEVCVQIKSLGFENVYVVPQLMIRNNAFWDSVDCSSVKKKTCQLIDILEDEKSKDVVNVIVHNWFDNASLYTYSDIAIDDQYFPDEIITLLDDEVFVDAGAFDGDTILDFLSRVKNCFERVIAYELDKSCYQRLKDSMQSVSEDIQKKIHLFNLGLFDENKFIQYIANSTSSTINLAADEEGEVVRLSDHLRGKEITFIKMDIEGAEVKALQGAKEIIKASKPKLAICVYHAPSHLWRIPLFIKSLVPEYKIYLRHHTRLEYETVCYAVL